MKRTGPFRGWLIAICIGAVLSVAVAGGAAWWYGEWAIRHNPERVIAWSPFPDHVMRAAICLIAANPAGFEPDVYASMVDRFPMKQLLRLTAGTETHCAHRSLAFIGLSVVSRPGLSRTSEARAAVDQCVKDPRSWIRAGWLELTNLSNVDQVPLVLPILDDPRPDVVYAALCSLSNLEWEVPDAELVTKLCKCIAFQPLTSVQPFMVRRATTYSDPQGIDTSSFNWDYISNDPLPPQRALSADEITWLAKAIRAESWQALAACDGNRFISEVSSRWDGSTEEWQRQRILDSKSMHTAPYEWWTNMARSQTDNQISAVKFALDNRLRHWKRTGKPTDKGLLPLLVVLADSGIDPHLRDLFLRARPFITTTDEESIPAGDRALCQRVWGSSTSNE